jgi:hypothetical protein
MQPTLESFNNGFQQMREKNREDECDDGPGRYPNQSQIPAVTGTDRSTEMVRRSSIEADEIALHLERQRKSATKST